MPGSARPTLDIASRDREDGASTASVVGKLPHSLFWYIFAVSWPHQLLLSALTATVFLLEVVPLELQRRAVNDLVKHRSFNFVVVLCAFYAGTVAARHRRPDPRNSSAFCLGHALYAFVMQVAF